MRSSHWIQIPIDKKNRLNSLSTKEAVSSEESLLSWCTTGYSACLSDWHRLWFSRQTAIWHRCGFSVLSHGGSVDCGREQQHLGTGWEHGFVIHLLADSHCWISEAFGPSVYNAQILDVNEHMCAFYLKVMPIGISTNKGRMHTHFTPPAPHRKTWLWVFFLSLKTQSHTDTGSDLGVFLFICLTVVAPIVPFRCLQSG